MHRICVILLALVASAGLFAPIQVSAGSGYFKMQTFAGVQNPHVQQVPGFSWYECYGCHAAYDISFTQSRRNPSEPCANCHKPITKEQRKSAQCRGRLCPTFINYWQSSGRPDIFFFGMRKY